MRSIFALMLLSTATGFAVGEPLQGRWDGIIRFDEFTVTFPIEFSANGSGLTASFFNGNERVTSTSGKIAGDSVVLRFDHYATELHATLTDGILKGTYGGKRGGFHEIEARPHASSGVSSGKAPDIAGVWDIPNESAKGEHAWRLIVQQNGADVSAAILRVDGDTGAIAGRYQDGRFVLNHFDGARAYVLEIAPQPEGSLAVVLRGVHAPPKNFVAVRQTEARARHLPEPADPEHHTRIKDPDQRFLFSFPDLNGKLVSNADPRFQDKVLIVNITGSWCPNCHDEAPFLAELYRRYHGLGLEIVALDFEEPEQLASKARLQAFIKKYGIEYTYLLAGEPNELQARVPQAENLNSWPTTFFLGRDGKVRAIHAGFAAPASGEYHRELKREVTDTVERLLAERSNVTISASQK